MTKPVFTILLPVHRPPAMLPFAIASVLAQERQDFELFVICDGAPPETAEVARRRSANDRRIRVFEHPKGERHGEAYRHQALGEAMGAYVCQLGDDDLWLPNHLSEMARLLEEFEFGNLPQVEATPDGGLKLLAGNLADPLTRLTMVNQPFNFFGPTAAGYRLQAYRDLPIGWSPAPTNLPTDLFMWRKFLARDGLRFGTRVVVSSIKFPAQGRSGWSLDQRKAEIARWALRLASPRERASIEQMALLSLTQAALNLRQHVKSARTDAGNAGKQTARMKEEVKRLTSRSNKLSRKLQKMRRSWSWRLTRPFRKLARLLARSRPI